MNLRKTIPGYHDVYNEISDALFMTTAETRILIKCLKELRKIVKSTKRINNISCYEKDSIEYLNQSMAYNLQKIIRQINDARKASNIFIHLNNNV